MTTYVVEINGRGIAAFNAQNRDFAEAFFGDKGFQTDLMTFDDDQGKRLWNGIDELLLREAFPEEHARFAASQARAIHDEEVEDEDDTWVLFLVPVTAVKWGMLLSLIRCTRIVVKPVRAAHTFGSRP